jgi:hypothetical protein
LKDQPILKKVLLNKISKGVLEYWRGKVRATSRYFLVYKGGYSRDDIRSWRLVCDVSVNPGVTNSDDAILPVPLEFASYLSRHSLFWETDLRDAYHQILLDEVSKELVCLQTPIGLTAFSSLPQGIRGAQGHLLNVVREIFPIESLRAYADNVYAGFGHSRTDPSQQDLDDCKRTFEEFLRISANRNVKLNIHDTAFGVGVIHPLGFTVGDGAFSPSERLTRSIIDMPRPACAKDVKSFTQLVNVFRQFVPQYNFHTAPLHSLLKTSTSGAVFDWTPKAEAAFVSLKSFFISPPILQGFDAALPSRLFIDCNTASNNPDGNKVDMHRPACASSLLQKHGQDWLPCGYASRYLTKPEVNQIRREVANSSSFAEGIGFVFGLEHFYPELSQLASFEVICDAANLQYWKTSAAPLMVRLRNKIAGMYDVDKVKFRHVKRSGTMLPDALARLPPKEDPLISGTSFAGVQLSRRFFPEDFSQDERVAPGTKNVVWDSNGVYVNTRAGPQFLVPRSSISSVFEEAHINVDGSHRTLTQIKAQLAGLTWKNKSNDITEIRRGCHICMARNKVPKEINGISHGSFSARQYGDEAAMDTIGPYPTSTSPKSASLYLDIFSGQLDAFVINSLDAPAMVDSFRYHTKGGVTPKSLLLDRAKVYLNSSIFRTELESDGVKPLYAKSGGNDHRFQRAERAVQAFVVWRQSLPDSLEWDKLIHMFVREYNRSASGSSLSRGEYAHAVIRDSSSVLRELKSASRRDFKNGRNGVMDDRFSPGDRALLLTKPKHRGERAYREVSIIEPQYTRCLINDGKDQIFVPFRNLLPLGSEIPPSWSRMEAQEDDFADAKASLEEGSWVLYRDGSSAHVAICIQSERDQQVRIQSCLNVRGKFFPQWTNDISSDIITAVSAPKKHSPTIYIINSSEVLRSYPRIGSSWKVPVQLSRDLASFNRDPLSFV